MLWILWSLFLSKGYPGSLNPDHQLTLDQDQWTLNGGKMQWRNVDREGHVVFIGRVVVFFVWRDINRSSHRRSLWIKAIDQLHSTAAPAWHPDFAGAKMTETWRAPRIQLATCLKRWIPLRFSLWFWSFSIARKACEPGIRSYHIADMRGCSIDQPRNLAKSVTVEWSRLK